MPDHASAAGGLVQIAPFIRSAQEAGRHRFLLGRAAYGALTVGEARSVVLPAPGARLAPDMLRAFAWEVLLGERGGWVDRARLRHVLAVRRTRIARDASADPDRAYLSAVHDYACRRADGSDGPACELAP